MNVLYSCYYMSRYMLYNQHVTRLLQNFKELIEFKRSRKMVMNASRVIHIAYILIIRPRMFIYL